MTKHTQKQYKSTKKQIEAMGKAVDALSLNESIKCLNFNKIMNLKDIYWKITPLINKHKGVIYGTTIGTSIKNSKIAIRKTDDLDVRFNSEKDRSAFVKDVMKILGTKDFFVKDSYFGAVICRKKDKSTIIDTHVREKGFNKKNSLGQYKVTMGDAYVTLHTKDKKENDYCNARGESYSVSAQKKYSAVLYDLNVGHSKNNPRAESKLKRVGKDALDVRLYNADAYIKAFNMWKKEKDPVKKEKLHKIINDLGRAILNFSARKEIINHRRSAERQYIHDNMLNKRTFTSRARMNKERALFEKLKKNPHLDLTKFGTDWLEAVPIKGNTQIKVNFKNML